MKLLLVIAVLGCASVAGAQTTSTSTSSSTSTSTSSSTSSSTSTSTSLVKGTNAGILATAQAAAGPSGAIVCFSASAQAARVVLFDVVGSGTVSATFQLEHSMNPGTAGSWSILTTPSFVAMTGIALSSGTPAVSLEVLNPVGCYRTNFTTLSTGTYAISYQAQE